MPQAAPAPGCSRLCWEAQADEFPFILQSAVLLISANQPQTGLQCPSSATPGDSGGNPEPPLSGAAAASWQSLGWTLNHCVRASRGMSLGLREEALLYRLH